MALLPIQGIGIKGIIRDINPIELPADAISNGNNIRTSSSGVGSAFGYEVLSQNPVDFSPEFNIHNHSVDANSPVWIVCGSSSIYAYTNGWDDVTPVGIDTDFIHMNWTGCNLGKMCVINNLEPLYYDSILGGNMVPLPFSPGVAWPEVDKTFKVIRNHNNFLFALNLTEGGEHYPDGYRWSHPADSNGIPFTWDETDPSGLASRESLGGDDGAIVDGLTLRNSFVIYSERGVDILDYNGDDFLFTRRSLATSAGILATNCVVEHSGLHYFISDGDVLVNDGTSIKSIMQDRVRRQFVSEINTGSRKNAYVVKNDLHKEIWFCVPTGSTEYADVAYIYNWHTDAWGRRDLPGNTPHAAQGGVVLPKVTWNTVTGTWRGSVRTWGARKLSPENETVVGCIIDDSSLNMLDASTANIEEATSFIERLSMPLEGIVGHVTANAIYPHMTGTATVQVSIGAQDFAGGPIQWGAAVDFKPGKDRKVDVRATGALLCYKVSYTGRGSWNLTGLDLDYVLRGQR